jgi:glycerol-3-phosphate dehydrogenase
MHSSFVIFDSQFSAVVLESISEHVTVKFPFVSMSKGLELNPLQMMSQTIPRALRNTFQPVVVLSWPTFVVELMDKLPTGLRLEYDSLV